MLLDNSNLREVIDGYEEIKNVLNVRRNRLKGILSLNGISVSDKDTLGQLIEKVLNLKATTTIVGSMIAGTYTTLFSNGTMEGIYAGSAENNKPLYTYTSKLGGSCTVSITCFKQFLGVGDGAETVKVGVTLKKGSQVKTNKKINAPLDEKTTSFVLSNIEKGDTISFTPMISGTQQTYLYLRNVKITCDFE